MKKVIIVAIVVLSYLTVTSCAADNISDKQNTMNIKNVKNADYGGNNGKENPPPKP